MIYEIEQKYFGSQYLIESMIGTLTGYELEDILPFTKKLSSRGFSSSELREIFREMGFNTDNRFVPFKEDAKYPCVIRCSDGTKDHKWYPLAYYNGIIYVHWYGGSTIKTDDRQKFRRVYNKCFLLEHHLKITSMMQVWI